MTFFNMDYLGEAIALGIDTLILGVCLKQYYKTRNAVKMIQSAPLLEINDDLHEIVLTHPDRKLPYVAIRGTVNSIGSPIVSSHNPKISGVVQLLSIKEHVVQRSTAGFWSNQERTIQEVHNVMPFVLESNNGVQVEVMDPLASDILDMDVISDTFLPSVPTVMDHVWGFFSGVRQRGVQTTEKMLRKGAVITGIGELVASPNNPIVRIQPPADGTPFYLTNMQIISLIRQLNDRQRSYRLFCIAFGAVGVIIASLMIRRYLRERNRKIEEEKIRKELDKTRKDRRRRMRDVDLPESQLCVVCTQNPREIILLPCGHVCLCEDCTDGIRNKCPVCRRAIEKKSAAYIS